MPNKCLPRQCVRALVIGTLAISTLALTSSSASAQGFIVPFIGFDYGGDSGCPIATGCEDKNSNIGVAAGTMGALFGAEVEFGYARDFFGDTAGVDNSVLTLMANVFVGPKIGVVRPYVLGGVGLIKTHVEFTVGSIVDSSNNFGWDIGGGVMVMFGDHVGARGDVRRLQSFTDQSILGFGLADEKIGFNRATIGLVLAF